MFVGALKLKDLNRIANITFVFCFVLLAIVLSVLQFTASDYASGIFKIFSLSKHMIKCDAFERRENGQMCSFCLIWVLYLEY